MKAAALILLAFGLTAPLPTAAQSTVERVDVALVLAVDVSGSVDDTRFCEEGSWATPPRPWTPEQQLLGRETMRVIEVAIERLPPMQQQVITLRDAYGWDAQEICELYGISGANQRILLHRARARIRQALEDHFSSEEQPCPSM